MSAPKLGPRSLRCTLNGVIPPYGMAPTKMADVFVVPGGRPPTYSAEPPTKLGWFAWAMVETILQLFAVSLYVPAVKKICTGAVTEPGRSVVSIW